MTFLAFALLFALIIVGVAVWTLVREKEAPAGPPDSGQPPTDRVEDPGLGVVSPDKGPPSAGQGLEALKSRLADMPTESLQSMLDMGATLKPGAGDLIQDELDRRRESE